jgi:hypothetical protein
MYVLLLTMLAATHFLASASGKAVRAVRTAVPPVIDGAVIDPQWQTAQPVLDFTQYDPEEGALPTEITSVRVLYDDRAIYVGVICYDSDPRKIVQQLTRRDRSSEADRFSLMIDSYHDRKTAFLFSTNVSGVQSDGVLSQDGMVYDVTWDAVWNVKTFIYRDGWSAEFEIPYSALRFSRNEEGVYEWGINFRRYISRKRETDEWVMVPRSETTPGTVSSVSQMGQLIGLEKIEPPLNLSLIPFISGKTQFETATPTMSSSSHFSGEAGLDVKYGLSPNFTLDATINPDFGQVEVDQAVLNLTVFETQYPEKRPFFIEGAQLFAFGSSIDNSSQTTGIPLALFFSRRIGRQPGGSADVERLSDSLVVASNPLVTTILGAAKVTGRSDGGFSVGFISAATGEEHADIKDSTGRTSQFRTEPRGLYNVVRLKQDWGGGSWLGALGTVTSKENRMPAVTGGLDWNLRIGEGGYAVDGHIAAARSSRTDIGRDGLAGRLLLSRIKGEHWLYTVSGDFYTRTFDINDVGFFAQPHDRGGYGQVVYQENFGTGIFRRYRFIINPEARWNWDGIQTHSKVELSLSGLLTNFWTPVLAYDYIASVYDDAERGIIGLYRRPASQVFSAQLGTDTRKNVSALLSGSYEADNRMKRAWMGSFTLTLRPVPWMELVPWMLYQRVRGEEAAVFSLSNGSIATENVGGVDYTLFGDRHIDELDFALRGTVTFTRTLSLQFFSQVLIARARHLNYRRLVGASDFVASSVAGGTYDFNQTTFNANVLLRWEFLPGSCAYLVWTQSRLGDSGDYSTSFARRIEETFALGHEDVLLVKISYWLPL